MARPWRVGAGPKRINIGVVARARPACLNHHACSGGYTVSGSSLNLYSGLPPHSAPSASVAPKAGDEGVVPLSAQDSSPISSS